VNGYPSPCGCALLAPMPCASTPCASVTACNAPGAAHLRVGHHPEERQSEGGACVRKGRVCARLTRYIYI